MTTPSRTNPLQTVRFETASCHTPGRWERSGNQIIALHTDEYGKHETLIAEVFNEHDWYPANRRLLTAAPALLWALQTVEAQSRRLATEAGIDEAELPWLTQTRAALAEAVL